jgi:hypothetical protein
MLVGVNINSSELLGGVNINSYELLGGVTINSSELLGGVTINSSNLHLKLFIFLKELPKSFTISVGN